MRILKIETTWFPVHVSSPVRFILNWSFIAFDEFLQRLELFLDQRTHIFVGIQRGKGRDCLLLLLLWLLMLLLGNILFGLWHGLMMLDDSVLHSGG